KVSRPPNAYILYRKDKHKELKESHGGIHNNEISVLTGAMWKNETPEVRAKYYAKSLAMKDEIIRRHPEYRYKPRRSSEIKRRNLP
ncbi:high mobility group box domain-containing protein, partial [Lasiosphaeris hirsuta]